MEGRDPYEDYLAINKELSTYNLRLLERRKSSWQTKWICRMHRKI